ncbi:MAG: hypothetical protein EKK32_12535 [Bradyrhizobiaceae bacterium]|nr:MAG: hypothetical protein EKK32_12535 [Bradyrhizobiaceae bacterium]
MHHTRHCEERSDDAIQSRARGPGFLRFARNDVRREGTPVSRAAPSPDERSDIRDQRRRSWRTRMSLRSSGLRWRGYSAASLAAPRLRFFGLADFSSTGLRNCPV